MPSRVPTEASIADRQARARVRRIGARVLGLGEPLIAYGGLVLVVLLQVPWVEQLLSASGLTRGIPQVITIAILASIFLHVRWLSEEVGCGDSKDRHFSDPLEVYPALRERIKRVNRADQKTLHILGLTLYTAWPSVRFWLRSPDLAGWKIHVSAYYPSEGVELSSLIPASWVEESRMNLVDATTAGLAADVKRQNVTIEAFSYDFVPALHGFRLGNGDLYYSILPWGADGKISREGFTYEFVPHEDTSRSAEAVRNVFDSWLTRAEASRWG